MREIYQFFLDKSFDCWVLPDKSLLFDRGYLAISIHFLNEKGKRGSHEDIYNGYTRINQSHLLKFVNLEIADIAIIYQSSENRIVATSLKLFSQLRGINENNTLSPIEYYRLDGIGETDMCASPIFGYKIHFKREHYNKLIFWKNLLNKEDLLLPQISSAYNFNEGHVFKERDTLEIISTNTKVRRIGYFKILSDFMSQYKRISKIIFYKKFEKYAWGFREQLSNHINNKGLIKVSKTGNSARHYITTSVELNFIKYRNNHFFSSKEMMLYISLRESQGKQINVFKLDDLDKLFFLRQLLKYDFIYISALLEFIYINPDCSFSKLQGGKDSEGEDRQPIGFQKHLLNYLENLQLTQLSTSKKYRTIALVIERIYKWENAKVYLEHVVMPRLNWLLDLDLISMSGKLDIELNLSGKKLFEQICAWYDLKEGRILTIDDFLDQYYIHTFQNTYAHLSHTKPITFWDNEVAIYLEEAFRFFRGLAPNRIVSSQALSYIQFKLYLKKGVTFEIVELIRIIKRNDAYIYVFHAQYSDGYIQRANSS